MSAATALLLLLLLEPLLTLVPVLVLLPVLLLWSADPDECCADKKLTQNPPEQMLRAECKGQSDFALVLARSLPRVVVTEASATPVAGGLTQVTLQLQNVGFLRSSATSQAVASKAVRAKAPVIVTPSDGLTVLAGETFGEMEHLEGRSGSAGANLGNAQGVGAGRGGVGSNPQVATLTWLVAGEGSMEIDIDFQRSARVRQTIEVPRAAPAAL